MARIPNPDLPVVNPATGRINLEWYAALQRIVSEISATTSGGVTSFEGRTGIVTAQAGDYTASEVTNTPAGNIAATTVQAAINELDGEKYGSGDSPTFTDITSDTLTVTDILASSLTVGTADVGDVGYLYALSDEGDYEGINHTLSDDYFRLIRISRVASSDGNHVPMDVALASRGTLDSPATMEVGDRSWAIAAGGWAASGSWQRLGYQWYEVKSAPSGDIIPGMWVVRVTKPTDYFPRDILNADWTDGVRRYAHGGFAGVIDQTDAATISWDVTQAQVAEVTLGGNRTLLPSGQVDGFKYDIYVTADASARTLSLSNSGGLEWYLKGSDGRFYNESNSIQLPAAGFAHISVTAGGGVLVGTVTFIVGHPRRAVVPSKQITSLTSSRSGSNNNSAQSPFNSSEDAITLAASTTYRFDAVYSFTCAATTNHTISTLFGGTATFTGIGYHVQGSSNETTLGGTTVDYVIVKHITVATATDIFGTVNENPLRTTLKLSGIMRINAGGTVIPQIQFSAAPGAAPSFLAGSYFEIWPIGDNNVVAVGDWA